MPFMRRFCFVLVIGGGVAGFGSALAAGPLTAGMRLAATCANCHGSGGVSAGGEFPSLAGRPKSDMLTKLRAYRSGSAPATIMHQLLKGYSEQELELIAAYFEKQPRAQNE